MKISELNTKNGGDQNPCDLISRYLLHELEGGTLVSFLQSFEFDTRKDVEVALREFLRVVYSDPYMRKKSLVDYNPIAAALFSRCRRIMEDQARFDKYPTVTSGEIWHGGFCRKRLQDRTNAMFVAKPDKRIYAQACKRLKEIYSLTAADLEKLRFFVEQVKAGERFPDSLRRMLYIWGAEKQTGKTTCAKMLVTLLNGDTDYNNYTRYSTTLSNEMQIKAFAVPLIAECNVCLMDECFYADMGKTYADFKRFMTSSGGRARLPFGQEFEWQGYPNYVATSNDPLKTFIKDWGDRRYLSIHYTAKPKVKMTFEEIQQLWGNFIVNCTRDKEWQEWADEIAPTANETGERQEVADELSNELQKSYMLNMILSKSDAPSRFCADNKITIKTFVDWFADSLGVIEAHRRKKEIEAAVVSVYGERYSTSNYWLLSDLKARAEALKTDMYSQNESESESEKESKSESAGKAAADEGKLVEPQTEDLPF